MPSIFLVEDDHAIRAGITRALSERGHAVRASATALDALKEIVEWAPDVVVLDLGLPDLDGREMLRMLRAVSSVPVVVASARDDEREIVSLLDAGADDYVVKPFSADHLEARVRAVLRRGTGPTDGEAVLTVGPLRIDIARREATLDGQVLDLSRKEFDVLAHLAQRPGVVVTKRELLAEVWRQPYGGAEKTVDVHLSWLRRKLGETAAEPRLLHTVRGVGVKLTHDESDA
jgi:DNA-binding response OmpR family regulator